MIRATLLALLVLAAVPAAALDRAPPAQRTGPITIYGEGSSGPASGFSVAPSKTAPDNTLAKLFYSGDFPGGFALKTVPDLDLTYAATGNPDLILARPGNRVSFCPLLSCLTSPTVDHQRASMLISATTKADGEAEEQTLALTTTVATGEYVPWTTGTAYTAGVNVMFQDERNAVYRQTVPTCTSAGSGTGPTGTGAGIADGTCRWNWINAAAINGKVGLYNEVQANAGGGSTWGQATNVEMMAGFKPRFIAATELDITNNSGTDCAIGVAAGCLGLYVRSQGTNYNTAAIQVEGNRTGGGPSALFGMRMTGALASDASISMDTTGSLSGIGIGNVTPASFTVAAINDNSSGPVGYNNTGAKTLAEIRLAGAAPKGISIEGTKSGSAIDDTSNAVAGINMSGAKSLAAIRLAATTFNGIDMSTGSYTGSQIVGIGWGVSALGDLSVKSVSVSGNLSETGPFIPPTANTVCTTGQHSWDANFEYRCVATNTWKRAALATW